MKDKFKGIPDYEMRAHLEQEELRKELQAEAREKTSKLETAFREVFNEKGKEINKHLKDAKDALNKAISISRETGIPLGHEGICLLSNPYTPKSFKEKWGDLDRDFFEEFEIYANPNEWGWEHSDIC